MSDKSRIILGTTILLFIVYFVFLKTKPSVNQLNSTVEDFIQTWYIDVNEPRFWTFVHPDSILHGGQANGYTLDRNEVFRGAFHDNLDYIDRNTFSLQDLSYSNDEIFRDLNRGVNKNIQIYFGSEQYLHKRFAYMFDEDPDGEYGIRRLMERGVLPNQQFLVSIYCVDDGGSYVGECVLSSWVPYDNKWKLFTMFYFD